VVEIAHRAAAFTGAAVPVMVKKTCNVHDRVPPRISAFSSVPPFGHVRFAITLHLYKQEKDQNVTAFLRPACLRNPS
jgi:hypothetical protein